MEKDRYTIKETMLAVGGSHRLYAQLWGNDKVKNTVIFLHGGPGSGCSDSHKSYFDPEKHRVIFFDQRGSGKSTPIGSTKNNTTKDLISDINKIAAHFKVKKFTLTGGSWGSCLALAYALENPSKVQSMVLRGIFTGAQDEIDWLDTGRFSTFFPEAWEKFVETVPPEHKHQPAAYHMDRVLSGKPKEVKESAFAYSELEGALLRLDDRTRPQSQEEFEPHGTKIEMHYMANHCFMPDKHILYNAHKLTMPIWLVHGRYDTVCPPYGAYRLHKALPNSKLAWTIAGHSGSDRANFDLTKALLAEVTS